MVTVRDTPGALSQMYRQSDAVPADRGTALEYLRDTAERGHVQAQIELAATLAKNANHKAVSEAKTFRPGSYSYVRTANIRRPCATPSPPGSFGKLPNADLRSRSVISAIFVFAAKSWSRTTGVPMMGIEALLGKAMRMHDI